MEDDFPVGTWSNKFGKWSPSWEGPYRVIGTVPGGSYFVENLEGEKMSKDLNGKYLKKYYTSIWEGA
jgi:hypothetical protein